MSERVRPGFLHNRNQPEGPWWWGSPQGISVDAAPEPNSGYPAAEVVSGRGGVTPQGRVLIFNPDSWYFVK